MTASTNLEASTPSETCYIAEPKRRAWYDGNFSFWWLLGGVLGLWFTLYKGFGILFSLLPSSSGMKVGPFFAIHLVTAALFLAICVYNIFHTPSHGGSYRAVHIILGRMAMIAGLISFGCGAVTAWWERYIGLIGFAIGITAGGVFQVCAQLYGWYQIRQNRDVQKHKTAMLATFFFGCLIPMWMRFVPLLGGSGQLSAWAPPTAVAVGIVIGLLGLRAANKNKCF
ncbi:unnamed protein product [Aphanomyces euteiches]|uniref:Cytochrome b561 domain-containing protein n=1 Tax=Aphanomyces euteiches TaxID=100861 RepID=A0A6G0XY90_9STRA|nr:hypothetical protein Ae201684_000029 [Aphanomyces euteiches]KAH9051737.1 hypothetical protein Ae201684P_015575 [Aphanomyces euteiches]KAH9120804.1 hypothetical protein LEN26_010961 [Aphanomyces euteiches]KAH9139423.1 hypothetical protein AeRB84_016301 [Aphanomyces euteiches]